MQRRRECVCHGATPTKIASICESLSASEISPLRGLLLQRRNLVRVARYAKDQIAGGGQRRNDRRGQLRQEGAQRRNDRLVPPPEAVFIVLHRVDDGNHHDEVEAVLPEVRKHIAARQQPELRIPAG